MPSLIICTIIFLCFFEFPLHSIGATVDVAYHTDSSHEGHSNVMHICIILERGSPNLIANYDRLGASVDLALDYVQEEILVDTDIILEKIYRDAGRECGSSSIAAQVGMKLFTEGVMCDVHVGPGCVDAASDIYNIASYYGAPVIAIPAGGLTTASTPRKNFPQLVRVSYRLQNVIFVIVEALKHLEMLRTVCIVEESSIFYSSLGEVLYDYLRINEDAFMHHARFFYVELNSTDIVFRDNLKTAANLARVIILFTTGPLTRRLMLLAKDAEMTNGDYIYFAVELFESVSWGILTPIAEDGRNEDAKLAFNSLFVVALEDNAGRFLESFQESYEDLTRDVYNYSFAQEKNANRMNPMVTAYFDAIVLYANAVRTVHKSGESVKNTSLVLAALKNCRYFSPVTQEIVMDEVGDRVITYIISDILPNGQYDAIIWLNRTTDGLYYTGDIQWPNGIQPVDVPFCGFLGDDEKCFTSTTGIVVSVTVSVVIFAVAGIAAKLYLKRRKLQDPYWWRVSVEDLDFSVRDEVYASMSDKDKPAEVDGFSANRIVWKAELHGVHLAVFRLPEQIWRPSTSLTEEMNILRTIHHINLVRFVGLCLDDEGFCLYLLEESCEKGFLAELMANNAVNLDDVFKFSFLKDIVEGMTFLHGCLIGSHGFLNSGTCLVNSKFMVKIDDFGITQFQDEIDFHPPKSTDVNRNFRVLLWRSPELLREVMPSKGTQEGDIYSFGILMQEIFCRSGPFLLPLDNHHEDDHEIKEFVMQVKRGVIPPCRPKVPNNICPQNMYEMMQHCWEEEPEDRPTFTFLRDAFKKTKTAGHSIVDHLLEKMEDYSRELEAEVARKTEEFKAEKARSDNLLRNMLPQSTADALTKGETVPPETFTSVTIFFSDIVGFADLISRITPLAVLEALNCLYHWSDTIMEGYDIYKVEAIADIFMVASGLPVRNGNRHVSEMASLSLHLKKEVSSIKIPNQNTSDLKIRIGMHSGPCVAGIVGLKMPRYCLFGDSVNTASRMSSHGEADRIHLSQSAALLLREVGGFVVEERGEMMIKGKGLMMTYWLNGSTSLPRASS